MKVLYEPCRPGKDEPRFEYEFQGETITAKYSTGETELSDTFDLSSVTDKIERNESGTLKLETTLPELPIHDAWREDGVLHVRLTWYYGKDATESIRFPDWQEVS